MSLLIDYIVNAVWQIPLIAIGAAVLTQFGRLGPATRHRVWLAALVLAAALPLLPAAEAVSVAIAPVNAQPPANQAAPTSAVIPVSLAPSFAPGRPTDREVRDPSPASAAPAFRPPAFGLPPIVIGESWARAIALVYSVVLAIGLVRLALAWRAAGAITRRAKATSLEPEVAEALYTAARLHGVATPPVKISHEIRSPVVAGGRAPTILIPPAFTRLSPDEQCAALLHELAHVARRDYAVNLTSEALALLICWHPVTWEIKAGARRSREAACDAIASGVLGSRDVYARRLISLADALRLTTDGETSPALVALISKSDLEDRLMQLIKGPRAPSKLRLLAASTAAAAALAPAVLLHVTPALAQDATPSVAVARVATASAPRLAVAAIAPIAPSAASQPEVAAVASQSAGAETVVPETVAWLSAPAAPALAEAAPQVTMHRLLLAQNDISPTPPAPPAPPPPPAYNGAPPAPPPPAPPAPRYDAEMNAHAREAALMAARAVAEADKAMASDEVRKAMAEAHIDGEAIRRQVAEAMDSPEVRRALAEARTAGSIEARQAIEEAKREVIRALDQAEREADRASAQSERRDRDEHDKP